MKYMKYFKFGGFFPALFFLFSSIANAQSNPIPNPGFEEWDSIGPVGWTMFDGSFQSTDAHSGLYALGGAATDSIDGDGGAEADFHLSFNPLSFDGYYQLVSVQNDFLIFLVWIRNHGKLIGSSGTIIDSNTSSGWVHFNVPITYTSNDPADSAEVHLFGLFSPSDSSKFLQPPHIGSSFVFDDLSLTASAGVNSLPIHSEPSVSNYPNPATESTTLAYEVPKDGLVTIEIFDLLGKKISTQQIFDSKGSHTTAIDLNSFPVGIYSYRVSIGGHSSVGQINVIR